jgi:hypothetical protein
MTELVTNGMQMLMVRRRAVQPIAGLGPRQLAWLESKFPGISRNRVSRLAEHERCAAAYRLAECIDEARQHVARSV